MSADGSPQAAPAAPETPSGAPSSSPTASLTMVRVARRRQAAQTARKRGDLTQHLVDTAPEPVPAIEPAHVPTAEPAPIIELKPIIEPEPMIEGEAFAPTSELAPAAEPVAEPAFQPLAEPFEQPHDMDDAELEPEPDYPSIPRLEVEPDERYGVIPMPASSQSEERHAEEDRSAEAETNYTELGPRTAEEIIDYWDILAGTREFPSATQLDRDLINTCWPNSVLLTFGQTEMPTITRLGEPNGEIEYNAMVTDWILSRGKQAAQRVEALEEEQRFQVKTGRERYRLVLLPLSNDGSKVDHMLCHISRLEQLKGVAAFKRWLAS